MHGIALEQLRRGYCGTQSAVAFAIPSPTARVPGAASCTTIKRGASRVLHVQRAAPSRQTQTKGSKWESSRLTYPENSSGQCCPQIVLVLQLLWDSQLHTREQTPQWLSSIV
eukprot:3461659-Pleurochrysis_carterae.AAC.2